MNFNNLDSFYRSEFDACEITTFVYLPVSYLNKTISYKYVVYSTRANGVWEYIHDLSEHDVYSRCIQLNELSLTRKLTSTQ